MVESKKEKEKILTGLIHHGCLIPPLFRNQLKLANVPPNSSCNSSRDVGSSSDEDSDDSDEDTPTRELVVWRSAVNAATSAAQLWIYATQLNQTIAWEKSIMKVVSHSHKSATYEFEAYDCGPHLYPMHHLFSLCDIQLSIE